MRRTAAFQSDLNLYDQLLTVLLLPPSLLAVAAPCCSRLQCLSFCFFLFVFPAEVMAAAPSATRATPLSPPAVYCHFCNLPDTLKKKRKKILPLFSLPVLSLGVSGWSHFSLPRVAAMLPGVNLLPP